MRVLKTSAAILGAAVASQFWFAAAASAQDYDVNAIQQELAQISQVFNACNSSFGQGMDQNFQNYLETGQYGVTQPGQGCDLNYLAQLNARAYQLQLMLARANGDTRGSCEIQWMPGCPEPGQ